MSVPLKEHGEDLMKPHETHAAMTIYTIGHSTHPIEKFIEMLKAHDIRLIADVRTIPRSWHNPQYNNNALSASLRRHDIGYVPLPGLGGLRHAKKDSINLGWENASFRGFADYMQTEGFEKGLSDLTEIAEKQRTTLLCAEALPWRCHRSLIADVLVVRGIKVKHIMSKTSVKEHVLTLWAVVGGVKITYPKPGASVPNSS